MPRRALRIFFWIAALPGVALLVLVLAPAPVDPAVYEPAPTGHTLPAEGSLDTAELLAGGHVKGPEDVAVDAEGRIYAGLEDGRIVRIGESGDREEVETFAETGGRPLGLDFDPRGHLIVCDAIRGLLSIDPKGAITVLATEAGGVPFGFTNDVDVAADGTVYFSDASSRFGVDSYLHDLLEARPHGRLMAYHPATGKVEILLSDLYFANGVALSRDEDFVLVNETYRYRIRRYWLSGPRAGTAAIFADRLPGFPDGVSANGRGTFWVALYTVRNGLMDRLHPHPRAKALLSKLPRFLWPKPEPYALVLGLDENGEVRTILQEPGGERLREMTSAEEYAGALYLGTLNGDRIGRYPLRGKSASPD